MNKVDFGSHNFLTVNEISRASSLPKTKSIIRPSLKSRLKSFRTRSTRPSTTIGGGSYDDTSAGGGGGGIIGGGGNGGGHHSVGKDSPSDDFFILESFSDSGYHQDELSVKICKDTIRHSLLESYRILKGTDTVLLDMESNKIDPTMAKQNWNGLSLPEKNHMLLWSAFIVRLDYLEALVEVGADTTFLLQREGFNALHLSSFSGCANCVRFLIGKGCDVNIVKDNSYTPLHYAVLGNSLSTAQYLIGHPDTVIADTVLHAAVLANAAECVQFLLNSGGVSLTKFDHHGMTPLHIAADRGMYQCLKIMLDFDTADIDIKTSKRKATALHLASENGYLKCAQLLIDKCALLNEINYKGQTALYLASKAQSLECVEILLKEGANINYADVDQRTPLHAAVCKPQHAYPVMEMLIRWNADVNARDRYGYSPLHVAALNEMSQCVDYLIMSGANVAARTKGGMSALSIINRKTPSSVEAIRRKLDECLSYTEPEAGNRELRLKLDFRYIIQNSVCGEIGFLQTLEKEGHREILEHPLCISFLHLKWEKIRRFYFFRLFLCLMFILLLSMYVFIALAHDCYNYSRNVQSDGNRSDLCKNNSFVQKSIGVNGRFVELTWYLLVLFGILEIIRKLYSTPGFSSIRQYFLSVSNLIEWYVIVSVFAISFVYTGSTHKWQNHVGAFAVLSGWAMMMIMIGQLPIFGTYVAMFTKVQGEFAKLLSAYCCLLIGFAVSFCVLFPTIQAFNNPGIAALKVLAMMSGELDFNTLLFPAENDAQYSLQFSSHVIFVIFLIFVTVILMNLLVGIAVHDIEGLHKTAGLSKLVRQTELIYFLELAVFHGWLPKRVVGMLKHILFVSPQAYRLVLHVRPLNPRENRLPKDVMENALNIARQRRKALYQRLHCADDENSKQNEDLKNIMQEVKALKKMLEHLTEIVNSNSKQ